mmetsp:Transcript_19438/g.49402  ORF Transcript_19438/g.49402 Transcript_19438/m.49402 type:complete len:292 (-) Transcript_19438:951-1826(-)
MSSRGPAARTAKSNRAIVTRAKRCGSPLRNIPRIAGFIVVRSLMPCCCASNAVTAKATSHASCAVKSSSQDGGFERTPFLIAAAFCASILADWELLQLSSKMAARIFAEVQACCSARAACVFCSSVSRNASSSTPHTPFKGALNSSVRATVLSVSRALLARAEDEAPGESVSERSLPMHTTPVMWCAAETMGASINRSCNVCSCPSTRVPNSKSIDRASFVLATASFCLLGRLSPMGESRTRNSARIKVRRCPSFEASDWNTSTTDRPMAASAGMPVNAHIHRFHCVTSRR